MHNERCMSGSEGGPEKPGGRKAAKALRPDPTSAAGEHGRAGVGDDLHVVERELRKGERGCHFHWTLPGAVIIPSSGLPRLSGAGRNPE